MGSRLLKQKFQEAVGSGMTCDTAYLALNFGEAGLEELNQVAQAIQSWPKAGWRWKRMGKGVLACQRRCGYFKVR